MTRKDFVLIAAVIHDARIGHTRDGKRTADEIAHRLATACATTNPRFDRARFLRACGVEV